MSTENITPIRHPDDWVSDAVKGAAQKLADELNVIRSTVFVCGQALDHGDTDLELLSANVIKDAAEKLSAMSDDLVAIAQGRIPNVIVPEHEGDDPS
jgi:hypothetical protein